MTQLVTEATLQPCGYQQLDTAALASAVGLTVPQDARLAIVQAEGEAVRWRDDGTDPTGTVGMLLADGMDLPYAGALGSIKFIRVQAGAILNVAYYR